MLSEISIPLFILYALQAVFLPIQIWNFLTRKSDSTRLRFLVLIAAYTGLNISSIVLLTGSTLGVISTTALGIAVSVITYNYVLIESGIYRRINQSIFSVRNFFIAIVLIEILKLAITGISPMTSSLLIFGLHQILAFAIAGKLITSIRKVRHNDPIHIATFCIGSIAIFLPLTVDLLENDQFFWAIVNIPFFIIATAYVVHFVKQNNLESELYEFSSDSVLSERQDEISNFGRSSDFSILTAREQEVAQLILEGDSYTEIADQLFINEASVRKHASNIFRKLKIKNLSDFKRSYQ